jgi:hypothetical protein
MRDTSIIDQRPHIRNSIAKENPMSELELKQTSMLLDDLGSDVNCRDVLSPSQTSLGVSHYHV